MFPFLPPIVGAPLSPCSTAVRVYGVLPGNTIDIYTVVREPGGDRIDFIARGMSLGTESVVIELPPGTSLPPRSVVKAVQFTGLASSAPPEDILDGVEVSFNLEGAILPAPVWPIRLHEGGGCTVLSGLIPGTLVTITDESGETVAAGRALDTTLRLGFNRSIRFSDKFTAKTKVCEQNGPESHSPKVNTFVNRMLTPPVIKQPLIECSTHISVGDVYGGSSVILIRAAGEIGGCFDYPVQSFSLDPENQLVAGEIVIARQGFPEIGIFSSSPETYVIPLEELPKPKVNGPLCAGSFRVVVENLIPGAIVTIYNNEDSLGSGSANGSTQTFSVVPWLKSGYLTVKQEFCGREKISDQISVVGYTPQYLPRPLPTVPFECATVVHVSNVRPGARIRIGSISDLGFIGEATASSNEVLVRVTALSENEEYLVTAEFCGDDSMSRFRPITLDPHATLPIPKILANVLPGNRAVKVGARTMSDTRGQVYPGAIVEVYVNGDYRGAVESGTRSVSVPIFGEVLEGDKIEVLQRICSFESMKSETIVSRCRGLIRVGLKCVVNHILGTQEQVDSLLYEAEVMRDLFAFHGFEVVFVGDVQVLLLPEFEMVRSTDFILVNRLMSNRDGLSDTDICVYQVPEILDAEEIYRPGEPGVVVRYRRDAAPTTVAHGVGHILGLPDLYGDTENERMMFHRSTYFVLDSESDLEEALTEDERRQMEDSRFNLSC